MSKLRLKDTEKNREWRQFIYDTSWEVNHTWSDWKLADCKTLPDRRKIETVKDLIEFLVKEEISIPKKDIFEFSCHGLNFLAKCDGNTVKIFRPSSLYIVENE